MYIHTWKQINTPADIGTNGAGLHHVHDHDLRSHLGELLGLLPLVRDPNPLRQFSPNRLTSADLIVILHSCSIKAAADGYDENISNKDDPEVRRLYDRNSTQYPYRSHGQYLRACYALTGCWLFILFNGWRAFVAPVNGGDFVACYVCVSAAPFPSQHCHSASGTLFFSVGLSLYYHAS